MRVTLEIPDETLALHIVVVKKAEWPSITLIDCSVPTIKLTDGAFITTIEQQKEG